MGSWHGRYPELDACRGIAILMMVFFHFLVDLAFLRIPGPDPFSFPLRT
ncbi:MAG: heparan-alpha-glucosaminide N-acetyltransferase domain-containing protein, partial [Methanospirillum sp.]|nr:heparan-alpha-glucosaminide N-acetyltransferase domain-containing protein [Methanospirillum sp.]